jgi:hypothetical protein
MTIHDHVQQAVREWVVRACELSHDAIQENVLRRLGVAGVEADEPDVRQLVDEELAAIKLRINPPVIAQAKWILAAREGGRA